MSAYSDIRTALACYGYPVDTNVSTGEEETYFVITLNTLPADFADDSPQHLVNLVMLHLYAPHDLNTVTLRKQIAHSLEGAGFTYPSITDASDEKQHLVFECQGTEAV